MERAETESVTTFSRNLVLEGEGNKAVVREKCGVKSLFCFGET